MKRILFWILILSSQLARPVWAQSQAVTPLLQFTTGARGSVVTGVGPWPRGLSFDGSHIWVSNYTGLQEPGSLTKIDVRTNTVVANVPVGQWPFSSAFDGRYVWVANNADATVSKVDTTQDVVVETIFVGLGPRGVAFDGTSIWVTNYDEGTVSKIDATTNTVTATVAVGLNPYGVAFDGAHIWVANFGSDSVSRVDITSNSVVATVGVGAGEAPLGMAFDGAAIWAVGYGNGNVYRIDRTTNSVAASVRIGGHPEGAAFDGRAMWVTSNDANAVYKINPLTNTVIEVIPVGSVPFDVAFDGVYMWVSNFGDNTVSKVLVRDSPSSALHTFQDNTQGAHSLTVEVQGDVASVRESTSANGSLMSFDLLNDRVSIGGLTGLAKFSLNGQDGSSVEGPHISMTTSADPFPLFYQLNWGHDDVSLLFDAYYDNAWKSSHAGSNFRIRKASNKMTFGYARGLSPGSSIMQWSPAIEIDASTGATSLQSIVVNDRIRVGSPSGLARWSLTGTNGSYLQGPHVSMATSADPFPLFYQLNWGHDDISLLFDAYYEGAWKSSHSGSNFRIRKASNKLQFSYASGLSSGSSITQWLPALEINATTGATTLPNLKAPAGQKYFVCIDDAGVLSSQPTPCQ